MDSDEITYFKCKYGIEPDGDNCYIDGYPCLGRIEGVPWIEYILNPYGICSEILKMYGMELLSKEYIEHLINPKK